MQVRLRVYKMGDLPLIIALSQCVMFLSLDINVKADVTLSMNTSQYMGNNDYYAHVGETVQLTCTFPKDTSSMVIYKETSSKEDLLVEDEELVTSTADRDNKYSYDSEGKKHYLTIYRLEISDSSNYGCRGCSNILCRLLGWWRLDGEPVYLDVKDALDESTLPDFCELVDRNIHGTFFIGDDLKLRCPTNVTIRLEPDASIQNKIEYETLNNEYIFNLILIIKNLTEEFNNTRISCFCATNSDESKDYCRLLPNIAVFDELLVILSPDKTEITNGGNVSFTCESQPFLPFAVQWDIKNNGVTFGNVATWETPSDVRLLITNIEFGNSTLSSNLTVLCNVTVGSVSTFDRAVVQHIPHEEFNTPLMLEISTTLSAYTTNTAPDTTNMTSDTTNMASGTTNMAADIGKHRKPPAFIFPVLGVVVIIILGVIISIFIYNKVRKPEKESGHGRTNDQKTQNTGNGEVVCYNSREKEKVQLGLTKVDSEVADNVAYGSFETVQ